MRPTRYQLRQSPRCSSTERPVRWSSYRKTTGFLPNHGPSISPAERTHGLIGLVVVTLTSHASGPQFHRGLKFMASTQKCTNKCRSSGSNQGPRDLQSRALPTELSRLWLLRVPCDRARKVSQKRREIDTKGIRTPAGKAQWISSPPP